MQLKKIKINRIIQTKEQKFLVISGIIVFFINLLLIVKRISLFDLFFHTDIARDLLLIEDMLNKGSPVLIGPRAGGIPGTFFGPLWMYLNTPFYILGNGDPVVLSIFWLFLCFTAVFLVMWLAKKIFGWEASVISGVIFSFYVLFFSMGFTQTFGSVILSPIVFYLVYSFLNSKKLSTLILLIFTHGILLQFQPAFGIITLAITSLLVTYTIFKTKKYYYFLAFFILIIPLFNYVIFEIRHNFLEIRSLIEFLTSSRPSSEKISFADFILNRFGLFMGRLNLAQSGIIYIGLFFIGIYLFILKNALKLKKNDSKRDFILIFFFYYFVFFILTLFFKGLVWDFYTVGFLPVAVVIFSSLYYLSKRFFLVLYIMLIIFMLNSSINQLKFFQAFSSNDSSSWIANKNVAGYVYEDADKEFGYFIYSPDEFGYSIKYSMNFFSKQNQKKAMLCAKKELTYLIYNPYLEDPSSPAYWKLNRVRLNIEPVEIKKIGNIKVEKYILDRNLIMHPHDPNIICDLHFR